MSKMMEKRLINELNSLAKDPPEGMTIDVDQIGKGDISKWVVDLDGAPGTLYESEKFKLEFKFNSKYPFDSPQVVFIGPNIPVHPHIYSNGHICLSILTEDWSPALSVQSVCISIVSMLSSCTEKVKPPGDELYVKFGSKNPKQTRWLYDDDNV